MLLKLGKYLIDPQKVIFVRKVVENDSSIFLRVYLTNQDVVDIYAKDEKELDEFFDAIWNASLFVVTTCKCKSEGE